MILSSSKQRGIRTQQLSAEQQLSEPTFKFVTVLSSYITNARGLKKYFVLIPTLIVCVYNWWMVTYNLASNHAKHMYLDEVQSDVNTALVAAEYEQLGLSC